jgi:hypothetical protein
MALVALAYGLGGQTIAESLWGYCGTCKRLEKDMLVCDV